MAWHGMAWHGMAWQSGYLEEHMTGVEEDSGVWERLGIKPRTPSRELLARRSHR